MLWQTALLGTQQVHWGPLRQVDWQLVLSFEARTPFWVAPHCWSALLVDSYGCLLAVGQDSYCAAMLVLLDCPLRAM